MRMVRWAITLLIAAGMPIASLATESATLEEMIHDADALGALPDVEQTNWTLETLSGCNTIIKPANGCNECNRPGRRLNWLGLEDVRVGGWMQLGYHTAGQAANSRLRRFNDYPDHLQLQQAWLYLDKVADGRHGLDFGGRIDYVYGTDAPNTQGFGTDPTGDSNGWDNGWDNGGFYGSAIPQLYGEAAYGDVSVKFGHFYSIIGYEVVAAPDNFFYSRSIQTANGEPLTHTGVLSSLRLTESMTGFAGYTMGWDSGFEDNGDAFLGGLAWHLNDRFSLTYTTSIGRLNESVARVNADTPPEVHQNERGHLHSLTTRYRYSERFAFISQKDWIDTELQDGTKWRQGSGFTNYFLYDVSRDVSAGVRFEWWRVEGARFVDGQEPVNIYNVTLGLNYRPYTDVIIRPEVRWDWGYQDNLVRSLGLNEQGDASQTTFGIDAIFQF